MVKQKPQNNAGPSQRQLRVGEELRHILSQILIRDLLRDPVLEGVSITVTEVRISPDLRNATAYVVPLGQGSDATAGGLASDTGETREIIKALNRSAAFIRGQIGREIALRHVPTINFVNDTAFAVSSRIDSLLRRPDVVRDLTSDDSESDTPKGGADGA